MQAFNAYQRYSYVGQQEAEEADVEVNNPLHQMCDAAQADQDLSKMATSVVALQAMVLAHLQLVPTW